MFFNDTAIPDNESGEQGANLCRDMKSAAKNCPVRYRALIKWFDFTRMALSKIEPMIIHLFHITGKKVTKPNCPIKMVAKFNPSSGSQSYLASGKDCLRPAFYKVPFFLKRPGPIYGAFSVGGHEGRPGHHTQVSHLLYLDQFFIL